MTERHDDSVDNARDEELAVEALHALADLDHLEPEADARAVLDRYRTAAVGLAGLVASPPPDSLGQRVAEAAARRRRPGRPVDAPVPAEPAAAYRTAVDTLAALLDELTPEQWEAPGVVYGRVHDIVAHLVGVERYLAGQLGLGPATTSGLAHDAQSNATIEELVHVDHLAVAAMWHQSALTVVDHLAGGGDRELSEVGDWYGVALSWADLCIVRTFELWTHTDDVRRAVGRDLAPPTDEQLAAMTDLAARLLPLAMTAIGAGRPGERARIVLTGRGGGSWLVPLDHDDVAGFDAGATARDANVLLLADAVDFCRVVGGRLAPDDLVQHVEGDAVAAGALLVGAAAMAAD